MKTKETENSKKLRELCLVHASKRYGLNYPREFVERLERELEIITQNGHTRAYLLAYEVTKKCRDEGIPHMLRGTAGASLVAFVLGITHTNPLPPHFYCLQCGNTEFNCNKYFHDEGKQQSKPVSSGFDLVNVYRRKTNCPECRDEFEGDGHDIPFEMFAGLNGEKPYFEVDVPNEHKKEIEDFFVDLLENDELLKAVSDEQFVESCNYVHIIGNPILSLFNRLQELTYVYEDSIPIDGIEYNIFFADGKYRDIPLLDDMPKSLVDSMTITCFSDIVRLFGCVHATTYDYGYLDPSRFIAHRDDVFKLLADHGIDRETAFKITKNVFREGLRPTNEDISVMKAHEMSDEDIEYLDGIIYLFPKAHNTEFAIKIFKLMWYRQHFFDEYEEALKKYNDAKGE